MLHRGRFRPSRGSWIRISTADTRRFRCAIHHWVAKYVNEVMQGPDWSTSAIIVTWDDFGGFYDHVPPPVQYGCDATQPYGQGFRLPAIIISPWVKQGVFHGVTEQASIPRLIEELFDGPAGVGRLNAMDPAARDAAAGSLLDAFDFTQVLTCHPYRCLR